MNCLYKRGVFSFGFLFLFIGPLAAGVLAVGNGRLGELDPAFNPVVVATNTATVDTIVVQPDGKILYAGVFLSIDRRARNFITRFNADGVIDPSFDSGGTADGEIISIALQSDGKILVAGSFSNVAGQSRQSIARLNADGSLDPTFRVTFLPAAGNFISTGVAIEPDGKIVFSGNFSSRIARVNTDGSLDTSFTAPTACSGSRVVAQPDGKIINNSSCQANTQNIARLNANGSLDNTFNPGTGASAAVAAIVLQSDGRILIGGTFSTFNGTARKGIARLNTDGSVDTGFNQTVDTTFQTKAIALAPDGKITAARSSGGIGSGISPLIRLNPDGSPDTGFHTTDIQGGSINAVAVAPDGTVYEGGFTTIFQNSVIAARPFLHIGQDGVLDDAFNPYVVFTDSQSLTNMVVQPDGKILAGGTAYNEVNRLARNTIVRFNPDGTLDPAFTLGAGLTSRPTAMVLQPDGKIIVNSSTGTARVVRLNPDGSRDTGFTIPGGADANVLRIALLPTGKILVAGDFTTIGGQTRGHFARLNSDGSVDSLNTIVGSPQSMIVQPDGKFVLSGVSSVGGAARNGSARINTDDSLDTTFTNTNIGGSYAAIQSDGRFIVNQGGFLVRANPDNTLDATFHNEAFLLNTNTQGLVNSVVLQVDGKILVGGQFIYAGNFTHVHQNIARLNPDGTIDDTYINYGGASGNFNASATGAVISQITLQADGKVLLSGLFNTFNSFGRSSIARLNRAVTQSNRIADFDGDGRSDLAVFRPSTDIWYVLQSTAGFCGVTWGTATDKLTPADFDGDGKSDIAVWREAAAGDPDQSYYFVLRSGTGTVTTSPFGIRGDSTIVNGDWDGDGTADAAVYRAGAAGGQSYFYYRGSLGNPGGNITFVEWGAAGDAPVRGDFDGDGRLDAAVYRPSDGIYYIRQSSNGRAVYRRFGSAGDKIVSGDYDGDGKDDVAVFRPSNGTWYIWQSASNQVRYQQFGLAADVLVPADYDGDGKTDIAVYRGGTWIVLQSSDGQTKYSSFGTATDRPVESAYLGQE